MGTYFSKDYSVPGSATSELSENTFNKYMRASSSTVNASSLSREHAIQTHDFKCTRTNEKITRNVNKKNDFVNEKYTLPKVQIERLQYSSTTFDALPDKTVKQNVISDDYSNKIVDVAKLLAQLMNAKVVLRKLEEPLTKYPVARSFQKYTDVDDKSDVAGESNCNDYATRYCPGCKKTKYAHIKDPTMKNCSDCETAMKYLCTKCNEKYYRRYAFLLLHLDRCEGSSNLDETSADEIDRMDLDVKDQSTDEAKLFLNKGQFVAKEFRTVNMAGKWKRYCPKCKVETTSNNDRRCTCVETLLFKCMKCHSVHNSHQALWYHLHSQCYPATQYQCTRCKYSTTCWQNMQKHFKFMHTDLSLIKCKFCSYETKSKATLNTHMKNMHDYIDDKFYCSSCTYSTKFERNLRRHKQLYH